MKYYAFLGLQNVLVLASLVAVSIANPPYPYGAEYNGYYGYHDLAQFGYDRQISSFGYYTGPTYPYKDYNGYPYTGFT